MTERMLRIFVEDKGQNPNKGQNPKLIDSGVIDCIPQTGQCPNNCGSCFYNADGFFRTKDEPLIPTLEEVGDKIVRVNSGNDSNNDKKNVLIVTEIYKKKFYNTSLPYFDFPGPVVFTCNGRDTNYSAIMAVNLQNLMMVRFRTNMWNLHLLEKVIDYYGENNIPVTMTFMRYTDPNNIQDNFRDCYELKKHVLNTYYCLKTEYVQRLLLKYETRDKIVSMCGRPNSSLCKDCKRCVWCYNKFFHNKQWTETMAEMDEY